MHLYLYLSLYTHISFDLRVRICMHIISVCRATAGERGKANFSGLNLVGGHGGGVLGSRIFGQGSRHSPPPLCSFPSLDEPSLHHLQLFGDPLNGFRVERLEPGAPTTILSSGRKGSAPVTILQPRSVRHLPKAGWSRQESLGWRGEAATCSPGRHLEGGG